MPLHRISSGQLPATHRNRLSWFEANSGEEVPFPEATADGYLATRAKGIYKPADTEYALSVRVMLSSPYADKSVEHDADGGWSLLYFQENPDPSALMSEYTNLGLLRCREDRVPVGVMVQLSKKPVRYRVEGLALVTNWEAGLFTLEGAATNS